MSRDRLLQNAERHLEDSETVQASALVRVGVLRQQNHALVATETRLYAFRLRWPGFSKIAEVLLEIPVEQATLVETPGRVRLLDVDGREMGKWQKLPGRDPQEVVDYVNSRGSRSAD